MIAAAFYLTSRIVVNGFRRRVARLREPRYAIALAAGLLYFYWIFARPGGGGFGRPGVGSAGDRDDLDLLLAWLLLALVALNWIFGQSRSPLPFTPAETQFLFTAPLTRRQVIGFKLLRLQLPLLASATISVLLFSRGHLTPLRAIQALGAWLLFTTLSLHFAAAAFVRANLAEHGVTGLRRQLVALSVLALVVTAAAWSVRDALPDVALAARQGASELFAVVRETSRRPVPAVLLFPFRLAVGPTAAGSLGAFAAALPGALAVLAAHYLWVVRSAIHFEDVAIEDAQRRARRVEAARRGRFEIRSPQGRPRRPLYRLRPTGAPFAAFFWKSLLAVTRQVGLRLIVLIAAGVAAVAFVASRGGTPRAGTVTAGAALLGIGVMTIVFGPRSLRQDLREDLLLLDVLKSYPVRGYEIVWGEVLGLATALSAFALAAGGVGFALLLPAVGQRLETPLAVMAAALLLVPAVVLVQVTAQNAFAILFPAWSAIGANVSAGVERLGQQIVMIMVSLVLLLIVLIPAGIAAAIAFAVVHGWSPQGAMLAGAAVAALVLVYEAYLGTYLIGGRLERTDPAEVLGTD